MKIMKSNGIGLTFLLDYKEFEIGEKIGEGGYGTVYKGKWLGREVAIKVFLQFQFH